MPSPCERRDRNLFILSPRQRERNSARANAHCISVYTQLDAHIFGVSEDGDGDATRDAAERASLSAMLALAVPLTVISVLGLLLNGYILLVVVLTKQVSPINIL